MKKLVYLVAVAFVASMAACGNSEKKAAEEAAAQEEAPVEVVEVAEVDTLTQQGDTLNVEGEGAAAEAVEAPAAE